MKKSEEGMTFPTFADLERLNEDNYVNYTYLFSIDDKPFYLVNDINRERLSAYTMENTEVFRTIQPRYLAFAGITGYQLYSWYQSH